MQNSNIEVLLVEDDYDDIYSVKRMLRDDKNQSYSFKTISTLFDVYPYLEDNVADVILLDLGLNDSNGLDTLLNLMSHNDNIPVIVLTGVDSDELGELTIKNGAEDYIPKSDASSTLLSRTIRYAIERNRLHQELKRQAKEDPLTKIPNRAVFFKKLEGLIEQSKRSGIKIALAMLDFDDFKPINDNYGHQVGDMLLQEFSKRLLEMTRITDAVARYGGDEFAILFTNYKNRAQLLSLLKKKHKELTKTYQIEFDGQQLELSIGVSIGVAEWEPTLDKSSLTKLADNSLYRSKKSGKNEIVIIN